MPKLSRMTEALRTVKVTIGGEDYHLTYRLGAINSELSDWALESSSERGALRQWLERVVSAWDVTDDNDQPVPITREAMEQNEFPVPAMIAFREAIWADCSPEKLQRRSSDARSSTRS